MTAWNKPALGPALLLAGCTPIAATQQPAPVGTPVFSRAGLENVIGRNARAIEGQFGKPDLDIREGPARKLQFASPVCVLDAYLYPPKSGGEPIVTYVDARLPDGGDIDRASCAVALTKRSEAR
jgi:hypothetical protein